MKHVEVFNGSPIRHVGLRCSILRSSMGLRSGMSVSDDACKGFRWVSDQTCRSPMGLRWVSDRCSIGFRWVSDNNNIFLSSRKNHRPIRLVGNQLETDLPGWRPIGMYKKIFKYLFTLCFILVRITHKGLRSGI